MKKGGDRSILRIRTFDEDAMRVRGKQIPEVPQIVKKKKSVQNATNAILKESEHRASDFIKIDQQANLTSASLEKQIEEKTITSQSDVYSLPQVQNEINTTEISPVVLDKSKKSGAQDLKDAIKEINKSETSSVLPTEMTIYDVSNDDLTGGTIITNKKQRKFKLLPAIARSVYAWFGEKIVKIEESKQPTHTISKAESRLETIAAAARSSKHAPQSDHGIVIKRLTKKKRSNKTAEVKIKKKEEVAAPQWSSVIESSQDTKNIPTPTVDEEQKFTTEQKTFDPEEVVDTFKQKNSPQAPTLQPDSQEKILHRETQIPAQKQQATTVEQPKVQKESVVEAVDKEKKERESIQRKVPQKKLVYAASPVSVSGAPIYIYILVIAGASLLGIGVSVYWFMSSTSTEEIAITRTSSLFDTRSKVSVPLTSNREDFMSTILDLSLATRETTQIYPMIRDTSSATEMQADAQTILNALSFRAPGSFTRAVTDITFGGYNGTDPFILMKVTNFDTAFGGLLEWEPDMSADLSPLFGTPVTQSYDPYARTDTQVRSAFFRDTVVVNKSVRLLVDSQNNERLMYAFVTPNLILITPNSETFKAVLPLVTQ